MAVHCIVTSLDSSEPDVLMEFCKVIFDLESVLEMRWIITASSEHHNQVMVSCVSAGVPRTELPDLFLAVDDFDGTFDRLNTRNITAECGSVMEPRGQTGLCS